MFNWTFRIVRNTGTKAHWSLEEVQLEQIKVMFSTVDMNTWKISVSSGNREWKHKN